MTIEELKALFAYAGAFGVGGIVFSIVMWMFLKSYFPTYLFKKAENLATREDIAAITHEIEGVKIQYAALIEEAKAKHQLRMAALDRRLQAHQEAFTLWRDLLAVIYKPEVGDVVLKCQKWWEANCLYLEPRVRDAFVVAYSSASSHGAYISNRMDATTLKKNWANITVFPNVLFEAVQLPALTELEAKSLGVVEIEAPS
jgi:hypothetical protein